MYIIRLCEDKTLFTTKYTPIYQGETGVTTIDIFVPKVIDNMTVGGWANRIEYILPNGVSGFTIPEQDVEDYDNYFLFHWRIPIELTRQTGKVRFWMIFDKLPDYNFVTSESSFTVLPTINVVDGYTIDDSITDQLNALRATKADSIKIDEHQNINLTANGQDIGDVIQINQIKNLDED